MSSSSEPSNPVPSLSGPAQNLPLPSPSPGPARPSRSPGSLESFLGRQVAVSYGSVALGTLKFLTFLPFLFVAPAVFSGNGPDLNTGVADVLGTGSEILFILCLVITPLVTLTGWRWIIPMRRWFGVMFGVSAVTDAIIASITTTDFAGGPVGRVAGHTFLLTGLFMVVILIPLILTGNTRAQKALGKYWKTLQAATYAVWALLVVHLVLLFGFGTDQADPMGVFHQRFYQIAAISAPLLVLRVPSVRKWCAEMRAEGRGREMWLVMAPLIAVFLTGLFFIGHEFFFKGIDLFVLSPSDN